MEDQPRIGTLDEAMDSYDSTDPDDLNKERAEWAASTLGAFQDITGTDDEDAVCDLLCDLMHCCDRYGGTYGNFDEGLRRARCHYEAETGGDES
jgi:hypothetical protein